jgi:diguanylate cyclase (GGDEF)-like protein
MWGTLGLGSLIIVILALYYYFIRNASLVNVITNLIVGLFVVLLISQVAVRWVWLTQRQRDADLEKIQRLTSRQKALVQLSQELAATLDEAVICRKVVRDLHEHLGYEYLRIYLKKGDQGERILSARIGSSKPGTHPFIQIGQDFSSQPFIDGQLHYIPDFKLAPGMAAGTASGLTIDKNNHPGQAGLPRLENKAGPIRGSEIDVPLKMGEKVIGVLVVRSRFADAFDADDFALLTSAAQIAAISINNARLLAAEKRQASDLSSLQQATAALLTTLNLDELLNRILTGAMKAIPAANTGSIYLVDPNTSRLVMKGCAGFKDPRVYSFIAEKVHPLVADSGYSAQAVRQRKPLLLRNVQADPEMRYNGEIEEVRAIQSAISAPLILFDEAVGVLSLDSFQQDSFQEDDLTLLATFATAAAAAIYNAQAHQEAQRLAITDSLTELYNRRHFFELARREYNRAHRYRRPLSAMMIDLDHFKKVNDAYGHGVGDQVLHAVAQRCQDAIRDVDLLGRYGGEEFSILLPEAGAADAYDIAERIRLRIGNNPITTDRGPVNITISIGIASLNPQTRDLEELLNKADAALYVAKQTGRNRTAMTPLSTSRSLT